MAGISGAETNVGWAFSNTWGTPASVTKGALLTSTDGLDGGPALVDDEAFNQAFLGEGEVGDWPAQTPEIGMQLRYEGSAPQFIAMAMGSAAAPASISGVAADSLVAYRHDLTLAQRLTKFITLAVDMGNPSQYVLECPSLKVHGFSVRVGDNGRMMVGFPAVGAKVNYNSTTNTNSTVAGASAYGASMLHRVYRKQGVFRMNLQGGNTLAATDAIGTVQDITVGAQTPVTTGDAVVGQDYILEPEIDGFSEFPVSLTFARANTVTLNSLAMASKTGATFKADLTFTGGYINSTTQRSIKFEWPALQIDPTSFKAAVTGHSQVRPTVNFRAKLAVSSPQGMAFVQPLKISVINTNSANLLS
jgi:hypothetical protein